MAVAEADFPRLARPQEWFSGNEIEGGSTSVKEETKENVMEVQSVSERESVSDDVSLSEKVIDKKKSEYGMKFNGRKFSNSDVSPSVPLSMRKLSMQTNARKSLGNLLGNEHSSSFPSTLYPHHEKLKMETGLGTGTGIGNESKRVLATEAVVETPAGTGTGNESRRGTRTGAGTGTENESKRGTKIAAGTQAGTGTKEGTGIVQMKVHELVEKDRVRGDGKSEERLSQWSEKTESVRDRTFSGSNPLSDEVEDTRTRIASILGEIMLVCVYICMIMPVCVYLYIFV